MKNKRPLVSVIITSYNYGQYIEQSISSVLNQTYENIELIIIDDCSEDNSVDIINKYKNDAKILRNNKNQGTVITRNKALSVIKGEYFIFVDADDMIPKDFIAKMVNTAIQNKLDVVYCDLKLMGTHSGKIKISEQSVDSIVDFAPVPVCQLVKTKWSKTHRFDIHLNHLLNEDNDFFFGLWADGAKFGKAKDAMYLYRAHNNSRSIVRGIDFYKPRFYILGKYSNQFPEITERIAEMFVQKDKEIDKRNRIIINKDKEIAQMGEIISQKDHDLANIFSSNSYKFGRVMTKPFRVLKGVTRK